LTILCHGFIVLQAGKRRFEYHQMDGPSLSLPFLNLALEQWGQATLLGPGLLSLWGEGKGVRNHSQFEIVDDLEATLEQFRLIANDLGSDASEKLT